MNYLSRTYEIDTGKFSHEPINTINTNYYYAFNNNLYDLQKSNKSSNSDYSSSISNNFKSFHNKLKNTYKNDYYNLYNSYNKFNLNNQTNTFTKDNINFNNNLKNKIILTYEYKDISPLEITQKTDELINLQSQMCHLDNKTNTKTSGRRTKSASRPKKNKNKTVERFNTYFESQKNFRPKKNSFYKSVNNIKKNKTFNRSMTNKLFGSKLNINRTGSIEQNRNNIWKNKLLKVNEEIKDIKNKIKNVKKNNEIIEQRLQYVKEKEENKDILYETNIKIKDYNIKLSEKYKISELIRKKQIDLIIKMQKEVNNMKEKLEMINQYY